MAKDTSGEVAAKTRNKNPSKKELTLQEAFGIVRKADADIKEIYSSRRENDVDINKIMDKVTAYRFLSFMATAGVGGTASVLTDIILADIVGFGSFFIAMYLMVTCGFLKQWNLAAPFKHRKLLAEREIHQQLIEFHEETMAEQAQAVLKKAKKALKVVNAALKEDGQSVYFNTTKGEEGFVLKQPENLDQFEMVYLRLSRKQAHQELELASSDVKALEATTVA